jgi:L-lactate utilization protein LutC
MKEGKRKEGAGLSSSTKLILEIYSRVARSPRLFAASQKLAALGSSLLAPCSHWIPLPAWTGWGYSKDFPRFAGKTFRERWHKNSVTLNEAKAPTEGPSDSSVALLPQSDMNRVEQFAKELTALGGYVYQSKNATQDIIQFLKSRDVNKIHLEPNTLDESLLRDAGITFTSEPDPVIRVGVTKAICALADTGSVLQADGEGSPLHASLLPEIHIAVLNKNDILPSFANAMSLVKDKRAAVFITGPSRTADIEMTLTIGVHGPKEIHVFVDDSIPG